MVQNSPWHTDIKFLPYMVNQKVSYRGVSRGRGGEGRGEMLMSVLTHIYDLVGVIVELSFTQKQNKQTNNKTRSGEIHHICGLVKEIHSKT